MLGLMEKHGFDRDKLKEKQITYRMVEEMVMHVRSLFPMSFGFDQFETVMTQVRKKMNVNPITMVEEEKIAFWDEFGQDKFLRWICYIISLQMIWQELKNQELGKAVPDPSKFTF
mmetsp:Transcript_6282/g.5631  ORF Transcript_6282/g.5631 Transcript_6282/m.5631 type:complete len:115 (-) Transcript_6282:121-465(-)